MSDTEIAQRSARGSFALFVGNLLNALIGAVVVIAIARLLGPDEYGAYTLVILIPNILLNFVGLGVNSGITRYAAYHLARKEPDAARRITINGLVFLSTFGVLLAAVCYAGAGLFSTFVLDRPELVGLVQFASLLLLAQVLFGSVMSALLGWSYMGQMSVTYVIHASLRVVLAVGLVIAGFGVAGAIAGYAGSLTVASVSMAALLWIRMKRSCAVDPGAAGEAKGDAPVRPASSLFISDVRTMLAFGLPLFVGQIALSLSAQFVVALLASVSSNTYVGFYQSAVNVTVAISLSSSAISQTLFPAFAHIEGRRGDAGLAFRYAAKYMGFVLVPIIFLLMAAASNIIGVLYPASYSPASPYLVLLSFSNIAFLLGYGAIPSFFNGTGRPRLFMACSFAAGGAQFVLAPLLGVYAGLGIPGLIYSVLAANLVGAITGLLLAARYLNAGIDVRGALSVLASSLCSYVAVLALQGAAAGSGDVAVLLVDIVVFSLVYLTVAPLARAIRPDDVRRLKVAIVGLGIFSNVIGPILAYETLILRIARVS